MLALYWMSNLEKICFFLTPTPTLQQKNLTEPYFTLYALDQITVTFRFTIVTESLNWKIPLVFYCSFLPGFQNNPLVNHTAFWRSLLSLNLKSFSISYISKKSYFRNISTLNAFVRYSFSDIVCSYIWQYNKPLENFDNIEDEG